MSNNKKESLQSIIDNVSSISEYLYNIRPQLTDFTDLVPTNFIPLEFTNWRDEQQSWSDSVGLFDQTHHMSEVFIEGPDALSFIERFGINSMKNFTTERPKQYVVVSPSGHMIGDGILHRLDEDKFEYVATPAVINWLLYQGETAGYDVKVTPDYASFIDTTGERVNWRFQLVGPYSEELFAAVIDQPLPDLKFFRTAKVTIRGCEVLAHRHSMTTKGFEFSGPFKDEDTVRDAILEVGEKYGVTQVGTETYFSATAGSGWLALPTPAIYTDPSLKEYREWLPAEGPEAGIALAGSFVSDNIEDYYTTPYDVGYGHLVNFDHDFVGREALENLPDEKKRVKVPLIWNTEDIQRINASEHGVGPRYKSIQLPAANYGALHHDEVWSRKGEFAGVSTFANYYNPAGEIQSIAILDPKFSEPGTEVAITWGEPNGGSRKPNVERHVQTTIRATVASQFTLQRI